MPCAIELAVAGAADPSKTTSGNIHDLAFALSCAAPSAPNYPNNHKPIIVTFFNAGGDKEKLQELGLDFDKVFWRSFDIQPMAKQLRPKGKVAGKGKGGEYKLIEACEEFELCMTSQKQLQARYSDARPRADSEPVQHCAVDDAANTVLLTVKLIKDAAEVDCVASTEEASPPKSVWPPHGNDIRILSIDTESCVLPEDMDPPRGYKYKQYMSELGGAFIDTDTIRAHPDDWQDYITTFHAIVAENWDHHPNLRCQGSMKIDHTMPYYPRNNASSGPSGCLQQKQIFMVDGEMCSMMISPDSEVVSHDLCLGWLLDKMYQPGV